MTGNSVVLERLAVTSVRPSSISGKLPRRQRVYIFFTRYGLIYCLNLLVMLLGAINYNNSLAYALTFLLCGLLLVGMLHTWGNLRGLIITDSPVAPVFVGQQACFSLLLDNRSGPARPAVELQIVPPAKTRHAADSAPITVPLDLAAHSLRSVGVKIDTRQRGYLVPGRLRITSTWPLGLFRAWSYMHIGQRCVVYPQPLGADTLPSMATIDEEQQAGKGRGTEDFIGFRQYQPGDSMRSVDWKAYARERGLLSKRFSGKGSKKICVDWRYTQHLADIEQRLSQLCRWILDAEDQGAHYALVLPGRDTMDFASGNSHRHRCLYALAVYGLDKDAGS